MEHNNKQTLASSLDFNSLRKLMDELVKLKKIDDVDSLDADYSFEWQEDADEMTDNINKLVNQTLVNLNNKDYLSAHYTLILLKIYLQNLNGTINGLTNDVISFCCDDTNFTWPVIPENYQPSE